jgi:flagellar biosynthetic protein FliQ
MPMEDVIALGRHTIEAALLVGAPILLIVTVVAVAINIVQVLTSVQESTVATVPKLLITGGAALALMPWMLRRLAAFTLELFSDFHRFTN